MRFIIFKTPRTGSSSLAQALNETPSVVCIGEALNDMPTETDPQAYIDGLEAQRTTESDRHFGFTLNPRKHRLARDFYRPPAGPTAVFLLGRARIGEVALSAWAAKRVGQHPPNRSSKRIRAIDEVIESRPRVSRDDLAALIDKVLKRQGEVAEFAAGYADANDCALVPVSYEGLYEPPFPDVDRVEHTLGTEISRAMFAPDLKILPPARDWVENYAEIEDLLAVPGR